MPDTLLHRPGSASPPSWIGDLTRVPYWVYRDETLPNAEQVVAIEAIAEGGAACGDLDYCQAPGGAGLIARGAEFHQQLLAGQLHRRQLLEPRPQPLQLTPPDCPLLGDTVTALRQNVELALLRQQLDPSLRWGRLSMPGRASRHGLATRCCSRRVKRPFGVPTR
jgi:hypothetical protein